MANIYGNDKKPLQPYTKKVPTELFKSTGINENDEKDISEVFEEQLGQTYKDTEHYLYPTQSRGIDTEAFYHSLFINIGALIGNIPDNSSIGDLLTIIQSKLESNIDPNILLNLISRILGPGIYNNGLNGCPVNFISNGDTVSFITTSIDSVVFYNDLAIYKNMGNKSITIDYSDRKTPNVTLQYKYVIVVKNKSETAFNYIKSILNSEIVDNENEEIALFMLQSDKLSESIDTYNKFINNGEVIELYTYNIKLGNTGQLIDFTNVRHFEPQNSNSFTISQLRDAISGNSVSLSFPKDMVEIIDTNGNDEASYVTKKMGEIVTLDDSYYEQIKDELHVVELTDKNRKLTDDEKVKYQEYLNSYGDVIPGDTYYQKLLNYEDFLQKVNNNMGVYESSLLGSIVTFPKKVPEMEQKGYLEMNGGEYLQADYPEFTEWCTINAPEYLSGVKIILPNWTARYLRNNGSITLNTTINGATVANTYNAGVPGTFSFDTMQSLTGSVQTLPTKNGSASLFSQSGAFTVNNGPGEGNGWSFQAVSSYTTRLSFNNALQARTSTENRPLSVAVVYYIKVKNIISDKVISIDGPILNKYYPQGSYILYYNLLHTCIRNTVWTGVLNEDWQEYSGRFIYQFKGIFQKITELPTEAVNGTCFYVEEKNKTYVFVDDKWLEIDPIVDTSEFVPMSEVYRLVQANIKPKFVSTYTYKKGDIVYIEPETYDEVTLPAGTHVNHLGKSVTYQAETKVKRYDVRLRSTKDNNTSDPIATLGTDWVVDEPNFMIEENKSTISSVAVETKMFAGGIMEHFVKVFPLTRIGVGASKGVYTYPIEFKTVTSCDVWRGALWDGAGDYNRTVTFPDPATSLTSITIYSVSTQGSNDNYLTKVNTKTIGTWY